MGWLNYHIDSMADEHKRNKAASFKMKPYTFENRVRTIAKDTDNIILSDHAKERCEERGITVTDVIRVLQAGFVKGEIELTEQKEWKGKMVREKGERDVGVITIILHKGQLFVKTVEWEFFK